MRSSKLDLPNGISLISTLFHIRLTDNLCNFVHDGTDYHGTDLEFRA